MFHLGSVEGHLGRLCPHKVDKSCRVEVFLPKLVGQALVAVECVRPAWQIKSIMSRHILLNPDPNGELKVESGSE